jgi:hypothetical protein
MKRRSLSPRTAVAGPLLVLIVALTCCSCSRHSDKEVFTVRGSVMFEGKPTPNAVVFFHPQGEPRSGTPMSSGVVGPDGSFEITTFQPGDGAPAGMYAVSIVWKKPAAVGDRDEVYLLPERYINPQTSGLRVEVKEGPNQLAPFQLTK